MSLSTINALRNTLGDAECVRRIEQFGALEKSILDLTHPVLKLMTNDERRRACYIARIEYAYWTKLCEDDPGGYGIEGMGAAANILGAIMQGKTAKEWEDSVNQRGKKEPK